MVQSNNGPNVGGNNKSPSQQGKGGSKNQPLAPVSGANTALIDPLNDVSDQELLYKIYTQQATTMTHEQLCREYKIMIKQLELLIETNKLLRFDIKQVKLQHDALQQQYNERIKYASNNNNNTTTGGSTTTSHSSVTIQTLQRDLLEKQLNETKHLVTTLTFVLQDKQQHIDLIKNTNKQLVVELDGYKKQLQQLHLKQQEQEHLLVLQQVANGVEVNGANLSGGGNTSGSLINNNTGQPFYF
jgi:hypothetical protein